MNNSISLRSIQKIREQARNHREDARKSREQARQLRQSSEKRREQAEATILRARRLCQRVYQLDSKVQEAQIQVKRQRTLRDDALDALEQSLRDLEFEKELECDPRLLSYIATPQFECPVFRCPSDVILQRLQRIRLDLQRMEVNQLHDSVVTINNTHWPAYRKEHGTLVDLRILDSKDRSPKPQLVFRPDVLRESGIPEAIIEAAAQSNPQGLVLFEDLPQFKGCAAQPTSIESTR